MARFFDNILRLTVTGAHTLLKSPLLGKSRETSGAHAVALTPEDRLVLVKLRYAPGWRLPGGGRSADEDACTAALRELREEIGMTAHGEVSLASDLEPEGLKRESRSIVVVRDVVYRPRRWSWEVEKVMEARADSLPSDVSPLTARWLKRVAPVL